MFYCTLKRHAVRGFGVLYGNVEHCMRIESRIFRNSNMICSRASFFFINLSLFSLSQGQAKVFALLEGLDSVPEDAEVYVVLEGSTLVHVTRAQSDVMLCFIVPGMFMCVPV